VLTPLLHEILNFSSWIWRIISSQLFIANKAARIRTATRGRGKSSKKRCVEVGVVGTQLNAAEPLMGTPEVRG